jgi:hypothetical protein
MNSEDRLVPKTFADYLHNKLGWESAYAWNDETFGPAGNPFPLRRGEREVLIRSLSLDGREWDDGDSVAESPHFPCHFFRTLS